MHVACGSLTEGDDEPGWRGSEADAFARGVSYELTDASLGGRRAVSYTCTVDAAIASQV